MPLNPDTLPPGTHLQGGKSENAPQPAQATAATCSYNGHEWVDLGLSVKWATCNVGASSPTEYGNYYAWGEITPKSEYRVTNSVTYGKCLNCISGDATYDAARANWGAPWRMPTAEEIDELVDKCIWEWTTLDGVAGCKVTSPVNGNSIFLPAAGGCEWSPFNSQGSDVGYGASGEIGDGDVYDFFNLYCQLEREREESPAGSYWCGTSEESDSSEAYNLFFNPKCQLRDEIHRGVGYSVRPVAE